MAEWYLRTRPRRRRVSWVKDFAVTELPPIWNQYLGAQQTRRETTVKWAHTAEERKKFPTRKAAIAWRDSVREQGAYGAKRWVAVNALKQSRPPAAFKPRSTVKATDAEQERLAVAVASAMELAGKHGLLLPTFQVYLTEGRRACRGGSKHGQYYIAIDRWAFTRDDGPEPGYLTYVVAHEIAHVADVYHTGTTSHGPQFMAHLRKLCPLELQAYELGYKRTAAFAAGIRERDAAPEVQAALRARKTPRFRMPVGAELIAMIERAKAIALEIALTEGK